MTDDLADVAGTSQTRLGKALLERLVPVERRHTAHAPWRCRLQAVLWWRPARDQAARVPAGALPAAVTTGPEPTVLVTVAAMVRYLDTPVGPYQEVLGGLVWLRRAVPTLHVPFMAVDSLPSVVGGRREWALPKTQAQFGPGPGGVPQVAAGEGWWVRVEASPTRLPTVPLAGTVPLRQAGPAGSVFSSRVVAAGLLRPTTVDVQVDAAPDLASWMPSGRCAGGVVRGVLRIGSPTVG